MEPMTLVPPVRRGTRPGGRACAVDESLDPVGRIQVAAAARLLRSVSPTDGEIEILLHEIKRRLEQIAEPDRTSPDRPAGLPELDRQRLALPTAALSSGRRGVGAAEAAEDRMGAVEQVLGELAELAVETQPQKVKRRSRDFYWYSPILKRELDHVTADASSRRASEAEIIRVLAACHRHRRAGDRRAAAAPAITARRCRCRAASCWICGG